MLPSVELDRLFAELKLPQRGRQLVRDVVSGDPVRPLQSRMDTVRTRFLSEKMGRAVYAESRTVELAAFVWYEHDRSVAAYYPQPCQLDLTVSGLRGGRTRIQHTPDVLVIQDGRFFLDEWRTEDRLTRLADERPQHFQKDSNGTWHYLPAEEHCRQLGIVHRLRSADELPRTFIANMEFLRDFSRDDAPLVPEDAAAKLIALLTEHKRLRHLELVYKHGLDANHVFAMVLDGRVYVDLHATRCDQVDGLVIYASELIARADAVLKAGPESAAPSCVLELRPGSQFIYDHRVYEVVLPGTTEIVVRDERGNATTMPLSLVKSLHEKAQIDFGGGQKTEREYDLQAVLANEKGLQRALARAEALDNPEAAGVPGRTLRRWAALAAGAADPQTRLLSLVPGQPANRTPRLPERTIELAKQVLKQHNRAARPTVFSTYSTYVALCDEVGERPMSKTAFYNWIKDHEDVRKREGDRKAYQKAPIPLVFDQDHPVHGVQPHEVVYCDHTTMNIFLKGMRIDNLGKPSFTLMTDGALSMARAFALLYRPPGTASVLMCLRDYARRWGCLPRLLVLDNGKEFHSRTLKAVCSLFGIRIRWRRRSKPRDSTLVERAIGVTEQELLSALDGNSIALKNPREITGAMKPENHIAWTLPALHGSLEHFLFEVQAKRIHPRFGVTPLDWERRLLLEYGSRSHRFVRVDSMFKLLTSPKVDGATRILDRRRGVFVDGHYYWNDAFAASTKRTDKVEVRTEIWNASVVYVCFGGNWLVAQARDGSRLEGRFGYELEQQLREERRRQRTLATDDRATPAQAHKRTAMLAPFVWDERLREQCHEEYHLYAKLSMAEALPEASNRRATDLDLGVPQSSQLPKLLPLEREATAPRRAVAGAPPVTSANSGGDETDTDDVYF